LAKNDNYKAIESFCGPGGMGLGLHWAGFKVITAFDYDSPSISTYNLNLAGRSFVADARNVKKDDLINSANTGEISLFSGGPPCQGFSKQKRGAHLGDDRNDLVLEYARLVSEIEPRYFLFENVAIFGQLRGKKYLAEMKRLLPDYDFSPAFYNSADFGAPQTRERFILVGRRLDQRARFITPSPTVKKWRTVGDVLGNMPEPPEDYSEHAEIPNHSRSRVTKVNIERFKHVPQGGGWKDIPNEMRIPCHQNADPSTGGWPDVYGRLRWDGQCPTITGGFDSFTRGRYGHPIQDRPITPREAARLQGFPDSYRFIGTRGDIRSQIGNVVPPPLAEAVGLEILRCLLIHDKKIPNDAKDLAIQADLFEMT
jgi:DNA (cytosine-5)-methyltransferase 1